MAAPPVRAKGPNPKPEIRVSQAWLRPSEFGFGRLTAVIVTLTGPLPSLYWQWLLRAGVRPGGWIGSAPRLKAGERAAERGFWGVECAVTGGSRAPREGQKS